MPTTKKDNVALDKDKSEFNVKKITQIYADDRKLQIKQDRGISKRGLSSRTLWSLRDRDHIDRLIRDAYDEPWKAGEVSRSLEAVDSKYAKLISYFADMFHVRYIVIPTLLKRTRALNGNSYLDKYDNIMQVVEGMSLETTIPTLLKEIYLAGSVYVYTEKYNPAKTLSMIILPQEYCRPVLKSNHGTYIVQFNFDYFAKMNQVDRDDALRLFPEEFTALFEQTKNLGKKWVTLDPKRSTAFLLNHYGMTPLVNVLGDIIDYQEFKQNDLERSRNELKSILTHQIPMYQDQFIFTLDEVGAIQKAISKIVSSHEGLETITTFGDTELLKLQEEGSRENKQVPQSYKNIYESIGLNANMWTSNSVAALDMSFKVDKASVIRHLNNIETFLNIAINNAYNFTPYEARIKLLHISIRDESEDIKKYQESAKFGIGKLEAIVASGVKQSEILDVSRLESALNLDEILKPLQSSHTQTAADRAAEEVIDDSDVDDENSNDQQDEVISDE
jgi:hypothetical protein